MTWPAETRDRILERIADGEALAAICREDGMPHISTVFDWLSAEPDFADKYARAREQQADKLADEIVSIADEAVVLAKTDESGAVELALDSVAVARNRLRIDARKWVASKLKPKKYGDKIEHEHGGKVTIMAAPEDHGL